MLSAWPLTDRAASLAGSGLAAEAGRGERAFDYFPTDYTERVRNPADVEQYMRAMLTVNASGPDEVEPAIDRAVAAFKRSHVVVNGWAVNIGDGGTADGPAPQHSYAAAGTYPVTAQYLGNEDAAPSAVTTGEVVIAKRPTTTTVRCPGWRRSAPARGARRSSRPGPRRCSTSRRWCR